MINVFSAHPDDCEISIGAFLLSLKTPYRIIYATKGEILAGKREPKLFWGEDVEIMNLDLPDCQIENNYSLRRMIEGLQVKDCLNLVQWPNDSHKDHREFSSAIYDACRGKNIVYYESVSAKKFFPNFTFTYDKNLLEEKVEKLKKAFQLDRYYLDEQFLRKNQKGDFYTENFYIENISLEGLKLLARTEPL